MADMILTEEQFNGLREASITVLETLNKSVPADPASEAGAIAMDLHIDSQTDNEIVYEVAMIHKIEALEVVGLQMVWTARDLEIIEKRVRNDAPFPAILTPDTVPISAPYWALGSLMGRPGTTAPGENPAGEGLF